MNDLSINNNDNTIQTTYRPLTPSSINKQPLPAYEALAKSSYVNKNIQDYHILPIINQQANQMNSYKQQLQPVSLSMAANNASLATQDYMIYKHQQNNSVEVLYLQRVSYFLNRMLLIPGSGSD